MSNPYELSDKNEEELSRITARIRQGAYQEGYAEGYKDGLARFVPEVDSVPIPKAINIPRNSPNMAERTLLNTAKELEAAESEIRYYRETLERIVKIAHNGIYGIGTLNDIEIVAHSALQ